MESGRTWVPFGEAALLVPKPEGAPARAVLRALRGCRGVTDVVVSEERVCVHFDPRHPPERLEEALASVALSNEREPAREVILSARYDGPDLDEVASRTGLSRENVVALHSAGSYEVSLVGFVPGFAYLRGLDERLAVPRRATARPRIAAGAIAIAASYTAVYPFDSPGGWNWIGTSPEVRLFDPGSGARLRLGDRVRFERTT